MPESSVKEDHFDLMIENPDLAADEHPLTTWQLPQWPFARQQLVRQLPAHRNDWLDLEGPVSGDRGFAKRVCRGQCVLLARTLDRWIIRFQTVDLIPQDPSFANAWTSKQKHIELVIEKCCESSSDDCWRASVH